MTKRLLSHERKPRVGRQKVLTPEQEAVIHARADALAELFAIEAESMSRPGTALLVRQHAGGALRGECVCAAYRPAGGTGAVL